MAVVRGGTRRTSAARERCGIASGNQARRGRLDIALDAGDLAGEKQRRVAARLPRLVQHGRPVDVGVAVDHAEAHELGLLEPRDHPQHSRLLAPLQLRLESDEAVVIAGEVVLPQLHRGIRLPPGSRIRQPDRLHRTEPQRVFAPMRHHLDRQAPFEELLLVEIVHGGRFCADERRIERPIFVCASSDSSGSRPHHRQFRTSSAVACDCRLSDADCGSECSDPSVTRGTPRSCRSFPPARSD